MSIVFELEIIFITMVLCDAFTLFFFVFVICNFDFLRDLTPHQSIFTLHIVGLWLADGGPPAVRSVVAASQPSSCTATCVFRTPTRPALRKGNLAF